MWVCVCRCVWVCACAYVRVCVRVCPTGCELWLCNHLQSQQQSDRRLVYNILASFLATNLTGKWVWFRPRQQPHSPPPPQRCSSWAASLCWGSSRPWTRRRTLATSRSSLTHFPPSFITYPSVGRQDFLSLHYSLPPLPPSLPPSLLSLPSLPPLPPSLPLLLFTL